MDDGGGMTAWSARLRALVTFPDAVGWRDHVAGAAVAGVYVLWLLAGARVLGFPRDEGVYFRAGTNYFNWWRFLFEHGRDALRQGVIDGAFSDNHEHPVLMKTLFGASAYFLHDKWRVFEDATTAFRFPAMCTAGLALWTTYIFGARLWSRSAGAVAACLLGLMPAVFFHAHLACFDVPIMAMWAWCIYVNWRALESGQIRWALAAGVVYGLALATKHNAWFLPVPIVPHALFVRRHAMLAALKRWRFSFPLNLVAMATLGPLVLYASWPYLWNDTMPRLQWWFDFHMHHEYYNIEFLGKNYFDPPSPKAYLPVMVVATVPTITLLLFGVGAYDRGKDGVGRLVAWGRGVFGNHDDQGHVTAPSDEAARAEPSLLLAMSLAFACAPFFLSHTPIFGGTKHWLPAYPALALFAGRGFDLVARALRTALPQLAATPMRAAQAGLVATVLAAPLAETEHSHPYGIAAYVPLVGGTAGGADLGLNRQFWGYTTEDAAAEYLNAKAPNGATVFINDTTWDAWNRMEAEKRVRPDLRAAGSPGDAQIALVQHELHMNEVDYTIWVVFPSDAPAYIVRHDGVPMVSIYRR
jgi:4-amino-4-deoxy-L-arabinose transferase-like glycosyltransferase